MKWTASAGELNLLSSLAGTPRRLHVSALVLIVASFGYGFLIDDYVQNASASTGANLALISGQFFVLLVAAYVIAMSAGTLFFGDRWRRRVLVGERSEVTDDADIDTFRDRTMEFVLLFFVALALLYFGVTAATGHYIERYNDHGFYRTQLRSPDPATRIAGIRALVDPLHELASSDAAVRRAVVDALEDDDAEVRMWAAWASGHLLFAEARPALVDMLQAGSLDERTEAALALGRLADPEGERRMVALLPSSLGDEAWTRALLTGLGLGSSAEAAPTVAAMLGLLPDDLEVVALWTIARARTTAVRDEVMARLGEGDTTHACAVATALMAVATVQDDAQLRALYRETPVDVRCEPVVREDRSYADDEDMPEIEYVTPGTLRQKYMYAVFNIAGPGLEDWLQSVVDDVDEDIQVRLAAEELMESLDRGPPRMPRE